MEDSLRSRHKVATRLEDMTPEELEELREGYIAMREENLRMAKMMEPMIAEVLAQWPWEED